VVGHAGSGASRDETVIIVLQFKEDLIITPVNMDGPVSVHLRLNS